MKRQNNLDAQTVARRIGVALDVWPGNCGGICERMLEKKLVEGRFAYGHYRGCISARSIFKDRRGLGFTHHGWILLADGTVCDPTRWVFTKSQPTIHFGPAAEDGKVIYDEDGQILAALTAEAKRPEKPEGQRVRLDGVKGLLRAHICDLLGVARIGQSIRMNQLFWLCNLPPSWFGDYALEFYGWVKKRGFLAFVPIDFRYATGFEQRSIGKGA